MPKIDQWLEQLGLGRYAAVFSENDIDFDVLPDLSDADLAALGISLGHRRKLLRAIAALGEAAAETAAPPTPPARTIAAPERRHLTVMFCDLVGSTELSTRLDPEDLRDVMQRFQETCVEVIGRYGGHIGNYIGDGILAYFGYPRAHEDDAQRAVRAGLGMVEAIAALNDAVPQTGIKLAIRVGINTGLVVVGDIGTGEGRDEMAVVGETPNVAARLQDLAEPGSVVVGASTYRLIEGLFLCDDLGPLAIRGVRAPVTVYRVREPTGVSRFEATATRGLTPLVGREDEVRLLLSRWRHAKEGEGQVVLLSGEPGIGKSRIIQSLREQLQDEPRVNLHYYCSPFYSSSALYPVLDQLERAADFRRQDPPAVKLEKLEALLGPGEPATGRSGGPAGAAPGDPDRGPLSAPRPHAATAPRQGLRHLPRSADRPRQPRSGPDDLRGRALDRPDLDRAVPADRRPCPAPAGPARDDLPARLRAAVERLPAHHARSPSVASVTARRLRWSSASPAASRCRSRWSSRSSPGPTACRCSSRS